MPSYCATFAPVSGGSARYARSTSAGASSTCFLADELEQPVALELAPDGLLHVAERERDALFTQRLIVAFRTADPEKSRSSMMPASGRTSGPGWLPCRPARHLLGEARGVGVVETGAEAVDEQPVASLGAVGERPVRQMPSSPKA